MNFDELKCSLLQLAREKSWCTSSRRDALSIGNFAQLASFIKTYWPDVVKSEDLNKRIEFIEKAYPVFKDEFNKFGLYYNEVAEEGIVLLHNCVDLHVAGKTEVYATGTTTVYAEGSCSIQVSQKSLVYCMSNNRIIGKDNATVVVLPFSRALVKVSDRCQVYSDGPANIFASNQTIVYARNWMKIAAFGDAVIEAPSSKKIHSNSSVPVQVKPFNEIKRYE